MKFALPILLISTLSACGGSSSGPAAPASTGVTLPTPTVAPTPTTTPTAPPSTPTNPTSGSGTNVDSASFAGLLNGVRVANSAAPVNFDARLTLAAQNHADDMLAQNYFSHTGLNGSTPGDRITAAGYRWRTYGENIAQGQATQSEAFDGWTNSPGHHANNINPNFEDFGLAKAGTGRDARWVLVLGAE